MCRRLFRPERSLEVLLGTLLRLFAEGESNLQFHQIRQIMATKGLPYSRKLPSTLATGSRPELLCTLLRLFIVEDF
jgi:hypothetical protein